MSRMARYASTATRALATPTDPVIQRLAMRGGTLGYTDEPAAVSGAAGSVLALHGGPGSVFDFRYIGGALDGRARLVRLDLPGHGSTEGSLVASHSTADTADVVREAGDALGLWDGKIIVMGHSLGAHVALEVAASLGRDKVAGVCLLCPVSLRPHRAIRPQAAVRVILSLLQTPVVGPVVMKPLVRLMYTRMLGFDPKRTSAEESVFTMQQVAFLDFERAAANADTIRDQGMSSTVCWALDDPILEAPVARELADRLGAGPRLEFATGGHYVNKSHAHEIADVMAAELAGGRSRL